MKLEKIYEMWEADSVIPRDQIDYVSLETSKLHSKYHQIYTNERLLLRKLESEFKVLEVDKHEFLTMGPTTETQARGWKLPPQGRIIKQEVQRYLDADPDLIALSLRIGLQQEKVQLLDSIIKNLQGRSYNIRNAIEYLKWSQGIS